LETHVKAVEQAIQAGDPSKTATALHGFITVLMNLLRDDDFHRALWEAGLFRVDGYDSFDQYSDLALKTQMKEILDKITSISGPVFLMGDLMMLGTLWTGFQQASRFEVRRGCSSSCEPGQCGYNACGHPCPECGSGMTCWDGTCRTDFTCADLYRCIYEWGADQCWDSGLNWFASELTWIACHNQCYQANHSKAEFEAFKWLEWCIQSQCTSLFSGSIPDKDCVDELEVVGNCKDAYDRCLSGVLSCPVNACSEAPGAVRVCTSSGTVSAACETDSRTPDVVIKSARFFSTIESDICQ
jgi:hypothetical protein